MWVLCVWVMKRVITCDTVRGYTGLIRPPDTTYKIKAPMNMAHIKRYGKKAERTTANAFPQPCQYERDDSQRNRQNYIRDKPFGIKLKHVLIHKGKHDDQQRAQD